MAEGIMTLEFDRGELKGVFINTALDKIYRRMYVKAKRNAAKNSGNIEHGIQVVVFGVFYLESLCNSLFKKMLVSQIESPDLAKSIWLATKKLNVLEKLKLVADATTTSNAESTKNCLKLTQKVFDLRNRLAHFKDEDWNVTDLLDYSALSKLENAKDFDLPTLWRTVKLPEPELMTKLRGAELQQYSHDIENVEQWMIRIFNLSVTNEKRNTVKF
jgi:hypothetical protein